MTIPSTFVRTITEVHGPTGEAWLQRVPTLIAESAATWSLILGTPFEPLSYNYVTRATQPDGTPVVLKAGVPVPELQREIEALRYCGGRGMVRLLEADAKQGVFMLEQVMPGTSLTHDPDYDTKAVAIAASVMRNLWRPLPEGHPFLPVSEWAKGLQRLREQFGGRTGPLPERLVSRAEGLFAELLASFDEPVLLHGDLHHDNILDTGDGRWLAIDPKGMTGEPAYEIYAFLLNPHGVDRWPNLASVQTRRIDQFADELGLDRERIRGWAIAQAVLSACWSVEDHGAGWERAIAIAEVLAEPT